MRSMSQQFAQIQPLSQPVTMPDEIATFSAEVEAEIDRIEAQTLERLTELPNNQVDQIELLGKLMLYDKERSVNRNQACAFCGMNVRSSVGLSVCPKTY